MIRETDFQMPYYEVVFNIEGSNKIYPVMHDIILPRLSYPTKNYQKETVIFYIRELGIKECIMDVRKFIRCLNNNFFTVQINIGDKENVVCGSYYLDLTYLEGARPIMELVDGRREGIWELVITADIEQTVC